MSIEDCTFGTVGQLRALLEGVPDDRVIIPQVVGSESGAWNMIASFTPLIQGGSMATLTLWHPHLDRLPMDLAAPVPDSPPAGKARVRIAVAVDEHGDWGVSARSESSSIDPFIEASEWISKVVSFCWVEADVPLPLAPATVQGTVTEAS